MAQCEARPRALGSAQIREHGAHLRARVQCAPSTAHKKTPAGGRSGIERGRRFPIQPADVVLAGGKAYLVVGHRRREVLVAPRARHLAGNPGVARLRNGDHVKAVLAKQHRSFSSIARTTAMHHGETAWPRKIRKTPGIKWRAGKSSLVEPAMRAFDPNS